MDRLDPYADDTEPEELEDDEEKRAERLAAVDERYDDDREWWARG